MHKKNLNELTRKELLALPVREWGRKTTYDSLLLISTGEKHDSGWAMIAVIGCREQRPVEIAVCCADDIEWKVPAPALIGGEHLIGQIRTDCPRKSGAIHFWGRDMKFTVGLAFSSTEIVVSKSVNAIEY